MAREAAVLGRAMLVAWAAVAPIAATGCARPRAGCRASLDVAAARCLAVHDGPVCLNGLGDVAGETAALFAAFPERFFTRSMAPRRDR